MRRRILVVDDDPDMRDLLTFTLKKAGYAVGTAVDGVDALKKACSISPDLILLDLMMPELDGFAVCEILRDDPSTASVPIIMLTAASGELSRFAGLDAGADEYVTKPFSPKHLIGRIEKLVSSRQQQQTGA